MKQILYHFRISLMLGLAILAQCKTLISKSIIAETTNIPSSTTKEAEKVEVPSDPTESTAPSDSPEVEEQYKFASALIIKAVNPGYTIDGIRDVGEFIELQRTIDDSLLLAGYSIRYTNSSGKSTTLVNFSEGSSMAGESLLLRLARSPDSDQSDATYMTTLAMSAGTIEVFYNENVVDRICWSDKAETDCLPAFKSAKPTILVRDLTKNQFAHLSEYSPYFNPEQPSLILPPVEPEPPSTTDPSNPDDHTPPATEPEAPERSSRCHGLEFSEILSYYAEAKAEQFVELYNPTDNVVIVDHCALRYKNKTYPLSGEINSDDYYTFYPAAVSPSFALTKNPTKSNTIELIDSDGSVVDLLVYNHGQKKSTSYAKFYDKNGEEMWLLTYNSTPGGGNVYQEFRSCPAGKTINPATGNCVKVSTATTSANTDCPAGKYRNPLTGRCKKIESASTEPKPCAEGYERNPETNRCRKVTATNNGAGYALVPTTYSGKSTFIALGVVILLVLLGIIYIILQFRREIARTARKLRQCFHHIRKNLLSRGVRSSRHKQS